jgi:hypothetical protein
MDDEREERQRQFSRRELLRAGIAVPVVLSLSAVAEACGGGSSAAAGHADHTDSGNHADHADHQDASHNDTAHGDSLHTDSAHTDHGHIDTGHGDAGHSDSGHSDAGHGDTGHSDTPHTDKGNVPSHGDHSDGFTHNDASGLTGSIHTDTGPHGDHSDLSKTPALRHADSGHSPHGDVTRQ